MKAVITVIGKDRVGIIANVSSFLAEKSVNILDISQTIVQGYFNMMMIVDMDKSEKGFGEVFSDLESIGDGIGVTIRCQRAEIFEKMHRL